MDLIEHAKQSIDKAEKLESKLNEFILNLPGMSSVKNRHLLNNLCNFDGCNFLEVGSYLGSTFCSAIYRNNLKATSIDFWPNYLEFKDTRDKFNKNLQLTLELEKEKTEKELLIINKNCFNVDKKNIKDVNIYFYDGDHSYKSQYNGLTYFQDILADNFILIVDDWNSEEARNGTKDGISDLKWKIEYEIVLSGPQKDWQVDSNYYWNGLGVFAIIK